MQKLILITCLLILAAQSFCQQKGLGYWKGVMDRDGSIIHISLEFNRQSGKMTGYFNSPTQKASGIPLDSISAIGDSLVFQLMSEPVTHFMCTVSQNNINGHFLQEGFSSGRISLTQAPKPVKTIVAIDTSFISGRNKIACRIYFPKRNGNFPSLVFMHGSGAEGMFANQYLAEYLAAKGIITCIQDKEGVGKSTGNWTTADFDQLTDDYVHAINFLKSFPKVNKKEIGIYGHSQGGTLAPLLASKSKDVSFIIAAASIGDTVYKQDLYRVENNLKLNGFVPSDVEEAMKYYSQWLNMARTGIGFEKLDSLTQSVKEKKWFDWVEAPPKEHWIWKLYRATGNYNSLDYWKKVTVPVLLIYGEKDQIEEINSYIRNIDLALVSATENKKDLTEIILPGAQHNLCIFPEAHEKFFWWYLSRGYEDLVTAWIKYRFKN